MRAVVLLRGVNVGGVRFRMADLATALEDAGFRDVRTVLASGNVLMTSRADDPAAVSVAVSAVIRERFGFEVGVISAALDVVRAAVDEYPFPRASDRHAYVVFADDPAVLTGLLEGSPAADPAVEQVRRGRNVLYWDAPKGGTLTTAFGKRLGARQRGGVVTTRSLNTLERVLAVG